MRWAAVGVILLAATVLGCGRGLPQNEPPPATYVNGANQRYSFFGPIKPQFNFSKDATILKDAASADVSEGVGPLLDL